MVARPSLSPKAWARGCVRIRTLPMIDASAVSAGQPIMCGRCGRQIRMPGTYNIIDGYPHHIGCSPKIERNTSRIEALGGVIGPDTTFRLTIEGGPYGVREIDHIIEILKTTKRLYEAD